MDYLHKVSFDSSKLIQGLSTHSLLLQLPKNLLKLCWF